MVAANLERPEDIPQYWNDAAAYLDAAGPRHPGPRGAGHRLRQLPLGQHRRSRDARPHRSRLRRSRAVPVGLAAVGQPAQRLRPPVPRGRHRSRGPRAHRPADGRGRHRVRSDLQYERFRTARPRIMWDLLRNTPGLGAPVSFGAPTPNIAGPEQPLIDEIELDADRCRGRSAARRRVPRRRSAAHRPHPAADRPRSSPATARASSTPPASTSWTPTRPASTRPRTPTDASGSDRSTARTPTWCSPTRTASGPGAGARCARTPATPRGPARPRCATTPAISASTCSPAPATTPTPSPSNGAARPSRGHRLRQPHHLHRQRPRRSGDRRRPAHRLARRRRRRPDRAATVIDLAQPTTTDHLTLLQPQTLLRNRWITKARLHFGDGTSADVDLDETLASGPGPDLTSPSTPSTGCRSRSSRPTSASGRATTGSAASASPR